MGARPRSRPDGQLLRRQEGPRQRDDGRAQRVRGGRERPRGVLEERVLSTAFLWHNYGKSTIGSQADIENVPIDRLQAFYRKYYQPDNAVLLVAGRFDEAKTLDLIAEDVRRDPQAQRARSRSSTPLEPTQDGERQVRLERVGDVQAVAAAYHVPVRRPPGRRGRRAARGDADLDARRAGCTRRSSRRRRPRPSAATSWPSTIPGFVALRRRGPQGPARRGRAGPRWSQTIDAAAGATPITQEEVERARATLLKNIDLMLNSADRVGPADDRVHRPGRLAAVLPPPRPDPPGHGRRRAARGGGVPEAVQPHARRLHPDGEARPRRDPAAARRRGHGQGLQGRRGRRGGRGVRPVARQHRFAHDALDAAGRDSSSPCCPRRRAAARSSRR